MAVMNFQLPPPKAWQAFEALCWDLFSAEWNTQHVYRHGRNGQKQNGVDIAAHLPQGWRGVQCKAFGPGAPFTRQAFSKIVTDARQFEPPLAELTIATTAPNDARLQYYAREVSERHRAAGLFAVDILGWDDLCARLSRYPDLVARHFPTLGNVASRPARATTDFAVRISNFATQYLSTPAQAIPFGGRDADLAALDVWLDAVDDRYRLIRAPAGRGKSALIVQWLQRVPSTVHVIFMPISVRYRTNLAQVVFPSLLSRLAAFHGESAPDVHEFSSEVSRGLVSDLIARPLPAQQRLLIVIDGLDEAADFEIAADFLPASAPRGLKVLLAGRPTVGVDFLAPLVQGKVIGLAPLAAADVQCIASAAGASDNTAAQIVRLAAGDPLLVRYYVEALAAGELRPEVLGGALPGMRGFFDCWWRDQSTLWQELSPRVRDLTDEMLCILSCALAPMSKDDIAEVLGSGLEFSSLEFDAVLARLARLLIGDGRTEGLAIAHPRFAEYIREERIPRSKRADVERRFVEWGLSALDALSARPSAVPELSSYLIRNLGAHLEATQAGVPSFAKLTSRMWADCWHTEDPSFTGFLVDVERCRQGCARALEATPSGAVAAPLIETLVTCTLVTSSIMTIRESIAPGLYVAALTVGYWSPEVVLAHIAKIDPDTARLQAAEAIAPCLQAKYSSELLAVVSLCREERFACAALCSIYRYLDSQAQAVAAQTVRTYVRAGNPIIFDLAKLGDPATALEIAHDIADPEDRVYSLAALLPALLPAQRGPLEQEILALIRVQPAEFEDLRYAGALLNLAPAARVGAVGLILDSAVRDGQDSLVLGLVRELTYPGDREIVSLLISNARDIADPFTRSEALQRIAPTIAPSDIAAYLSAAGPSDAGALGALGAHHAGPWAQEALKICAQGRLHPSIRAPILVNASRFMSDAERLALAPTLLDALNAEVDSRAWDEHDPDWLLADFAETFMPTAADKAIEFLAQIHSEEVRAHAASNLYLIAAAQEQEPLLNVIWQIRDPDYVIDALVVLASNTSGEVRNQFCKQAREYALATGHGSEFIVRAVHANLNLQSEVDAATIQAALRIPRLGNQLEVGQAIAGLAPYASAQSAEIALWIAARVDDYESAITVIFSAFASHFSPIQLDAILARIEKLSSPFLAGPLLDVLFNRMSSLQQERALHFARQAGVQGKLGPLASCAKWLRGKRRAQVLADIDQLISELPAEQRKFAREAATLSRQKKQALKSSAVDSMPIHRWSLQQLVQVLRHCRGSNVPSSDFGPLIESLARQPRDAAALGFHTALNLMGRWHRGELLSRLGSFAPVIDALGGSDGIQATLVAIQENMRTWG